MNFPEFLRHISTETRKRGIDLILVGGWALSHHGVSRQTLDVDFLTTEHHLDGLHSLLEDAGYHRVYRTDLFAKYRADPGELLDVDLLFVEEDTLRTIRNEGRTFVVAGAGFVVPSLFHLIAMKLHALRHNRERRHGRDLPDVLALIDANDIDVHREDFKELCLRFGSPMLYQEIRTHRSEQSETGD